MSRTADSRAGRSLLEGPAVEVAPRLLGAVLEHDGVAVRLTEVEAYAGAADPGSHAHRGRTQRNEVMFGPAGHLYCYQSHGIHICANVSVGPEGEAGAVLLRAGEVVAGLDEARARRGSVSDRDLARGPGRLCRALGIELHDDGADVIAGGTVTLTLAPASVGEVRTGPRTGLRRAADRPWRYWLAGEPTVSPYRRHPRAEAG